MDALNSNLDCNQTINQFVVELTKPWVGMNVKTLTHSQQQPDGPKTHKNKPTIRQAIRTVFCAPPPPPPPPPMKSSARHYSLSNQQAQLQKLRLVNLTENAAKHTFKAPC